MKDFMNKNILLNFIINFVFILMVETIFKIVNKFSILDWSSLRIILSTILLSMIISGIEYFVPKKIHKFINIIILFIISIYALAQTGFNNFIGVYMSLGTSSQLGAVIDYIREFILSFKWYYYFVMLPFILCLVYYIFVNKIIVKKFNVSLVNTKFKELNKDMFLKKVWGMSIIFISIFAVFLSTLKITFMQNKLQTVSNMNLYNNPSVPSISVKQFGITNFGILDVKNYFVPSENSHEDILIDESKNKETSRSKDDTKWKD